MKINIFVFIAIIALLGVSKYSQAQTWEIMIVDTLGSKNSIALDTLGHPHIAYEQPWSYDGWGKLRYASWNGYGWEIETVDSLYEHSVGFAPSLKFDSRNYPHIVYGKKPAPFICHLMYAKYNGTNWNIEHVPSIYPDYGPGEFTSLALDSKDHPHIAGHSPGVEHLEYVADTGTGWYSEVIETYAGEGPSIALDEFDNPHISYPGHNPNVVKYAYYDGVWHFEVVDSTELAWTSLARDHIGNPHISYIGDLSYELRYAVKGSSGWEIETIDSLVGDGLSSLCLDSLGYPHIAYGAATLKYAVWNGIEWVIDTVDTGVSVGYPHRLSLTLDPSDRPHISYRTSSGVKYATIADIHFPAVHVLYPNGGESFAHGDTCDITWLATDNVGVDSISILYSIDAGLSWDTIATGEPNDSLYEWVIPNTPSDSCLVKVLAYDPSFNIGEDQSDSFFSIAQVGIEEDISMPKSFVFQVSPNPFTELVKISLVGVSGNRSIGEPEIRIYDVSGRLVKQFTINDSRLTDVVWDGKDDSGRKVKSGVYFLRFEAGDYQKTKKLLFLRLRP